MSETTQPADEPTETTGPSAEELDAQAAEREHQDELVEEWGDESFPASDPPENY
ncbi:MULTISPECIES: hypothetical protein [Brevibacterium]|uniref:Uncharacterized protein n=2 Tax=Brevibacterium TaxID=1696 RepID=A0ABP9TVF9_9MICO